MFYSDKFIFDNITSDEMGVMLVSFENETLQEYGVSYKSNLQSESLYGYGEPFYYDDTKETEELILNIALVDSKGIPKEWTIEERTKIISWLVQDKFKPFISEDEPEVIHYFKCVGVKKKFNSSMKGVLELTMKPSSPYAYTPIVNHSITVKDNQSHSITIDNTSDIAEAYYPQIEVICLKDGGDVIEIFNTSTQSSSLTLFDLKKGERVVIDGLIKSVFNDDGESRLLNTNRNWISLKKGKNIIKVLGESEVTIRCQYPVII